MAAGYVEDYLAATVSADRYCSAVAEAEKFVQMNWANFAERCIKFSLKAAENLAFGFRPREFGLRVTVAALGEAFGCRLNRSMKLETLILIPCRD